MKNFFKHIRRQPKAVRDNYAFGFAGAFTTVAALFWFMSWSGPNISTTDSLAQKETNSPFATLIKESKEQLSSVKEAFSSGKVAEDSESVPAEAPTSAQIILTEEEKKSLQEKLQIIATSTYEFSEETYPEIIIATSSVMVSASSTQNNTASGTPPTAL